jgi:DNA-binding transcriptional MocR family regulator
MTDLASRQVEVPEGVIDLGVGQPDASVLPIGLIEEAAIRALSTPDPEALLQYGADQGDGRHRLVLSRYLASAYGVDVHPAHLVTTNGTSQALDMICTRLTRPGDVVVVEEPTYFFALGIFADHGLEVVGVPMDDEGIDLVALETVLVESARRQTPARFVYTIPASQNPTGLTSSWDRRQELAEMADRHATLVVADEVYQLLHYVEGPPPPMSALVPSGSVISLGTFSKILAPGLRLGWAHTTPDLALHLAGSGLIASGGGLNPLVSGLVTEVIDRGDLAIHVDRLREEYQHRVEVMDQALRTEMPEHVTWSTPTGGYFFWLRLPEGTDGAEVRRRARHHDVDVREGNLFTTGGTLREYIRLSFAYYRGDDLVEGVSRLARALHSAL